MSGSSEEQRGVWVLDSEAKGTGAHVAPLAKNKQDGGADRELELVQLKRPPRPEREPQPQAPPATRFKVVDVLSGRTLALDATLTDALTALATLRTRLDARVFARRGDGRWQLLTISDQQRLWQLARRRADGDRQE